MKQYTTLVEALADLEKRGFTHSLDSETEFLYCKGKDLKIHPEQFEIVEFYRFEGFTDPEDSSILYAIESKDHEIKGVLVSAYGAYADGLSAQLAQKLKFH